MTASTIPTPRGVFMDFKDLLTKHGFDLGKVMVMRHRPKQPELRKVLPWLAAEKPEVFNAYQQAQNPDAEKALMKADILASFIAQEGERALFVGFYRRAGNRQVTKRQFWVAVSPYVVVWDGDTLTVPLIWPPVSKPVPTHELAFVHDQVSVDCWPCLTVVGLAVRVAVGWAGGLLLPPPPLLLPPPLLPPTGDEDNHQRRNNNDEKRLKSATPRRVHTRPPTQ